VTATTGRRQTRQQAAITELLAGTDTFTTAQELHAELRQRGHRVGLATVYRSLQQMVTDGQVDVLRSDDGESAYRRCGTEHHHHLVCRVCGRTVEVTAGEVEEWARRVGREHGFSQVSHQVELTGNCRDHLPGVVSSPSPGQAGDQP
jgi:Fur family ferric uptake transcriptional regulator